MGVFEREQRPLRARDLCLAPGFSALPKRVEGSRAKLKRLVGLGFFDEAGPGLFARSRPEARTTLVDSDSDPVGWPVVTECVV
jgi:hypothetical protein